jgi:serine/threonine-protein kinase HipA
MDACTLEIFVGGRWTTAGKVHVKDESAGYAGPARFEYDLDYLEGQFSAIEAIDARAVSCRYPLSYDEREEPRWPAFLLDVIPSGAARRFWEHELSLPNAPSSDWAVLTHGARNPPGNLRVAEATRPMPEPHPGFLRNEVVERANGFLEYARAAGAEVAGASGAGGDSPKFLLREDHSGKLHPDEAIADVATKAFWVVKFPRSPKEIDAVVLQAEAGYHRVARRFGAEVHGEVTWVDGSLWIPRFDRVAGGVGLERRGLESLCSLAGVSEFGERIAKETLAKALGRFATDGVAALREFVLRDVLDVALGNTDNHARNTAVTKDEHGSVAVSPLYDFAPMLLDSTGISRVCRWRDEEGGFPSWTAALEVLGDGGVEWLRTLVPCVRALPQWLDEERVPDRVRTEVAPRIERVARALEEATK